MSANETQKLKIREAVLVEGRYDAHAVRESVDCAVLTTEGFGVFRSGELRVLLKRLAAERGLIILTDSDRAGFLIRSHLKGMLPKDGVKHAYIPEIAGKERRKAVPGKDGLLGVEGMSAETIRSALLRAEAGVCEKDAAEREVLTKADFYEWKLSGAPESGARREIVLKFLGFPVKMSSNAMLSALGALYNRSEAQEMVKTALEGKTP